MLDLLAVEGWRALLGLLDGQVGFQRQHLLNILNVLEHTTYQVLEHTLLFSTERYHINARA